MKTFRARLKEGVLLIGALATLPAAEVTEIFSRAGFDWIFIDLEHSQLEVHAAADLIRAAAGRAACVLRVPLNDEIWIKKALDTGCDGVLIPQVNSLADAQKAVRLCKYPPRGTRSVGITCAQAFGMDGGEYLRRANEDVALIVQIEHREAVANLEEILSVEGIDAALVGPYDLSASYGKPGQIDAPEVREAIQRVQRVCREHGIPPGIFSATAEGARVHIEEGCRLVAVSSDVLMLGNSAREILKNFGKGGS